MAALSAELLRQGKSVLVTALTNQALIELVKKKDLKDFLDAQKVTKTSLTVDESKELPKLQPNKKIYVMQHLVISLWRHFIFPAHGQKMQ